MNTFPRYLLRLRRNWQIVFPTDKADLEHTKFWEKTACHIHDVREFRRLACRFKSREQLAGVG